MIYTINTAPRNFLIPVGDRTAYIMAFVNELRDFAQLRPETHVLLWEIIERMYSSAGQNDPFPCLEDLRRVLEYEAAETKRPNLLTIARAVQSLCAVMGEAASIRVPAKLENPEDSESPKL